ncbi:class I SAM-dependent methyltransferase [Microvirga puerhi]|uniref:Class I SAM-dependent methyltransferase n=1 Tax=Microvirga puerhi TaxID=2876078 RepID=A0ABS7VQZ4_9HYPH|nr:class I SAM-dependent methyltransferase [Microvirga puerhi]MBZ6077634.1 class I SAM-dependent methyltransferase [Microvirga puerhi]
MPSHDAITLNFYAGEAEIYAARGQEANHRRIDTFLKALPAGGTILELGCGGGQDSEAMLARGFDVTPTDGSPEIAREAEKRLGRPVRVLLFEDLDARNAFDGIFANASLLHVPRKDLPRIIERVHAALRAGGVFYASFKAGLQEGRDRFDRYYNYPSLGWLRSVYDASRWRALTIEEEMGSGYDDEPTNWLHVMAVKKT